jgi:hypothetical protein
MLSVVITASGDASALARLLTALVPGVAEHLVRDVVVRGASGASHEIADDAGATIMDGGTFAEALARTRSDWIAGLPLTAVLAPGWIETLSRHMTLSPPSPARLIAGGGILAGRGPEGWLAPRTLALSAGVAEQDLQRLARRSGAGRLRILARG